MSKKPSEEKVWEKFYSKKQLNINIPNQTILSSVMQFNKNRLNLVARNYYGRKLTYNDYFAEIFKCIYALMAQGIEKGDVITFLTPTLLESEYLFYAATELGAVANLVDPRVDLNSIKKYITSTNTKLIASIDVAYPKLKPLFEELDIPVLRLSANDSLPFGLNIAKEAKDVIDLLKSPKPVMPKNGKFMTYKSFIEKGKAQELKIINRDYSPNRLAVLEYTGGTTGVQKAAMISAGAINAQIFLQGNCLERLRVGDTFLNIMPMFLSYGLVCGTITSMSRGMEVILVPGFKEDMLDDLLLKYRPNHMCGVPKFYERLPESEKLKMADLSHLHSAIAGGAPMTLSSERKVNRFLKSHASSARIQLGYGMTELASAFAYNWFDRCHEEGYVGIPLPKCNMKVVDENGNELSYNEQGSLYCSGPIIMNGYSNEEVNAIKTDNNGLKWVNTGDYAIINEEGLLKIVGRKKRSIIRPDGHNVFPSNIEEVIASHDSVSEVMVIGLSDNGYENGEIPSAFVKLNDNNTKNLTLIEEELKKMNLENLPERDVALQYFFVKELPYTKGVKPDFVGLKKMFEEGTLEYFLSTDEITLKHRQKRRFI